MLCMSMAKANFSKEQLSADRLFSFLSFFCVSGLTKITEQTSDTYCDTTRPEFPCGNNHYNGRGPLQLSWYVHAMQFYQFFKCEVVRPFNESPTCLIVC